MELPLFGSWFNPWFWLSLGILILFVEVLILSYFLISFSLASFLVAGIIFMFTDTFNEEAGLFELSMLLFIWAFLSGALWIVIGKFFKKNKDKRPDINDFGTPMKSSNDSNDST